MKRHLKASRYVASVLLGVVVLMIASVFMPHDPYIRWQSLNGTMFERAAHQYERLHFDPAPVDVIFIGSSRTARAINPRAIRQAFAKEGAPINVVDLSLPSSGMDIRVSQARAALKAHPETKLLVVSVVEALPRDGHQTFADLASARDIFSSPLVINRNLPKNLAKLPMRQLKLSAATLLPGAFGYRSEFDHRTYAGAHFDWDGESTKPADFDFESGAHARALAEESDFRKGQITAPILPANLSWVEFGVSRSSIEEIETMAKANGTKLAFLFLPFYQGREEPMEKAWLEEKGPLWIADWMRLEPSYYIDAAHASPQVEPIFADWIALQIGSNLRVSPPIGATQQEDAQ